MFFHKIESKIKRVADYKIYSEINYFNFISVVISLLKLKIIYEVCPLSTNIIVFALFLLIFLWITFVLSLFVQAIFKKVKNKFENPEDILLLEFGMTFVIVIYLAELILPLWMSEIFSCLNLRFVYVFSFSYAFIVVFSNATAKQKEVIEFSDYLNMALVDFFVFVAIKYPFTFVVKFQTSFSIFYACVLTIGSVIITIFQNTQGSRFFFPNKYRTKDYEYRRIITKDFELFKINECEWPECNIWIEKLNQPSLLAGSASLKDIEGDQWFSIYMLTRDKSKVHYFCLMWMLDLHFRLTNQKIDIDKFDD